MKKAPKQPVPTIDGQIPTEGIFNAKSLAAMMGLSPARIRAFIQDYDIPYRQPGGEMFVDVKDFWSSFPVKRYSTHRSQPRRRAAT